jgi:hypothetical protein
MRLFVHLLSAAPMSTERVAVRVSSLLAKGRISRAHQTLQSANSMLQIDVRAKRQLYEQAPTSAKL